MPKTKEKEKEKGKGKRRAMASSGNDGGRWLTEGAALHYALLCFVFVLLLWTVKNAKDEGEREGE